MLDLRSLLLVILSKFNDLFHNQDSNRKKTRGKKCFRRKLYETDPYISDVPASDECKDPLNAKKTKSY